MKAAAWLLTRFGVDASLIGDLVEQHRSGRSRLWFWRQTVVAIAARVAATMSIDLAVVRIAAVVAVIALAESYLWMHVFSHYANVLYMTWYPYSIDWMARTSPHAIWQIVVFLHPWAWTFMAGWCAMLAVIAWCLVRLWAARAKLILGAFVLSTVSQTLPILGRTFFDWTRDPTNPVWISNLVLYAMFVLVAVPLSIRAGGRHAAKAVSTLRLSGSR